MRLLIEEICSQKQDLFSLNSKIRDYDIILEMLSKYTEDMSSPKREQQQVSHSSQVIANISKSLESLRKRRLESKTIAVVLKKLAVPKLDSNKVNKSEKKLMKRLNSVVSKFGNSININITNCDSQTVLILIYQITGGILTNNEYC